MPTSTQKELESLRAELEKMSLRVKEMTDKGDSDEQSVLQTASELAGRVDWDQLSHQVADALKNLGTDVKNSQPKALIAAFVAGFIAGRVSK